MDMEWSREADELIDTYVKIKARRLRELTGLIADRIDQDAGDISIDSATGHITSTGPTSASPASRLRSSPCWGRCSIVPVPGNGWKSVVSAAMGSSERFSRQSSCGTRPFLPSDGAAIGTLPECV